jgi:hypothetical protein
MLVVAFAWGIYHLFYLLFVVGYLLAATQLENLAGRFEFTRRILEWPGWQRFALVVLVAIVLRWLMLLQDQVITYDLDTYVGRAERMLGGELPYLDFSGGTKPPAYQYMLYLMGWSVGPDPDRFRALFSVADALVAGLVYAVCRTRYGPGHSMAMGMVYAMCPVGIVTIGLSGHFEGVVNLFMVAALWAFWKQRLDVSALMLGVAFSLKIYPAAVLPFLAIAASKASGRWELGGLKRWTPTVRYGCLFALPAIASLVPLAIADTEAVDAYLGERGVFKGWGSFTTFVRYTFDVEELAGIRVGYIPIAIIGVLLIWLFVDWLRNERVALRRWIRLTVATMAVHYGFFFALTFPYYRPENWEVYTAVFLLAWFPAVALLLRRFLPTMELGSDRELSLGRSGLVVVCAISLMLFVLAMPTLGTWYFLWPLPFVLVIGQPDVRDTFLWLLFWHGVGTGVALLPGLGAIN